jgi:hypothetical protein
MGTRGSGGSGGGGSGNSASTSTDSTAGGTNLGGGGGGGDVNGSNTPASAGGSGRVIIRYADTFPLATSTTGSPTITTSGGYRIYDWTGSGSITI